MVVIALDIGGTKIKGALIDKELKILKSLKIPTFAKRGKKAVLENIYLVIDSLISSSTKSRKVTSIGISFPGFANEKGKLLYAGNALASFVNVNLKTLLEKKFSLPVVIENDANCFTLAESYYGAGVKDNIVLGITWGSGIGSGLVVKNQHSVHQLVDKKNSHSLVYKGACGGALELGHIPLLMANGKTRSLEQEIGGAFLTKKHKVENVTELYVSNKKEMNYVMKRFAQGLAIAINILNPDVVVIGGGVSNLPSSAFKEILTLTKKYALPTHTSKLKIKKYSISADAGLIGIAAIALKKKL